MPRRCSGSSCWPGASPDARLRRDPRLQPAGPDLPGRRLLQAVLPQAIHIRPSRHQSRALRGQVRPAGLLLAALMLARAADVRTADVSIATNKSYREDRHRARRHGAGTRLRRPLGPEPRRCARCRRTGLEETAARYLVGYVGVMGGQEGIDLLLEAVAAPRPRPGRHDIQFVVSAAGPALRAFRRSRPNSGLDEYVTFTGRVTDETFSRCCRRRMSASIPTGSTR